MDPFEAKCGTRLTETKGRSGDIPSKYCVQRMKRLPQAKFAPHTAVGMALPSLFRVWNNPAVHNLGGFTSTKPAERQVELQLRGTYLHDKVFSDTADPKSRNIIISIYIRSWESTSIGSIYLSALLIFHLWLCFGKCGFLGNIVCLLCILQALLLKHHLNVYP